MRRGFWGASTWLLMLSAAILAVGACIHGFAFYKATAVVEHSSLPPSFQAAFKALWLSDSISSLLLAIALASVAVNPKLAEKPLVVILAAMPLGLAIILLSTMGFFLGTYLMFAAAASALLAAALRPTDPTH